MPDAFTQSLLSLVGLGTPALRHRLHVSKRMEKDGTFTTAKLAHIQDMTLLYYSGFFAHRPRSAVNLEVLLRDYFQLPVVVEQFRGQWLHLDTANLTRMGAGDSNNQLGVSVVAGERVWDVQSKIRLRVGPLTWSQFREFLPSRVPTSSRKVFFLLCHLTRLYVGPEVDFEVQLILRKEDVPECQLNRYPDGPQQYRPQLGWNTWMRARPAPRDAEDAVFEGEEVVLVDAW